VNNFEEKYSLEKALNFWMKKLQSMNLIKVLPDTNGMLTEESLYFIEQYTHIS
jgi:hypothetical protein